MEDWELLILLCPTDFVTKYKKTAKVHVKMMLPARHIIHVMEYKHVDKNHVLFYAPLEHAMDNINLGIQLTP